MSEEKEIKLPIDTSLGKLPQKNKRFHSSG